MTEDQKRIAALAQEFDVLCDVDFHERAAEYAAAIGKDEPGEYEYYAAVRDGLDALRASVQPGAVQYSGLSTNREQGSEVNKSNGQ